MASLTVVATARDAVSSGLVESLGTLPSVASILLLGAEQVELRNSPKVAFLDADLFSGEGVSRVLDRTRDDYILGVFPGSHVRFVGRALDRFVSVARDSGAGLVYSDFVDEIAGEPHDHPLPDYQRGSIRDEFDFGPVIVVSKDEATKALKKHGGIDRGLRWGGFYDLRLKLSIESGILRIPEPLYSRTSADRGEGSSKQFDYVDPRNREYQLEMEAVATEHLKRIGACLPSHFEAVPQPDAGCQFDASIVIPVRNRERTIGDAVASALSQTGSLRFNVIVVDNHSTDKTTGIIRQLAERDPRLIHLIPAQTGLGIGGCWNEAIYSPSCGRVAVQLDSDDLYRDQNTLARMVRMFEEHQYGMVIGAYTIVDFDLKEIPPGLIDHREWTRENGRNNALRINGFGAPRAFWVPLLRQLGFPNVSYGEDYAVGLRISREYEIGRIYESLYYARRWEGNSDARLDRATANRYDTYKDRLRTIEIEARQRSNRQ
jgi:hypothetical protein